MISRIETIETIKPIYSEYLNYMRQFYTIYDYDSWHNGAFKNLNKYMVENDHFIYILMESDIIIGFALVNKHLRFNADGFSVAEFYIQKKYQKKGYGSKLAEYVFSQFSGNWEVAVALKNTMARSFWKKVVSSYTNGDYSLKKTDAFKGHGFGFNN